MTPIVDIETDVEQVARLNKTGTRGIIVPVFNNVAAGTIVRLIPVFDGVPPGEPLCDREDLDTTTERLYKKFGDSGAFDGNDLPKVGDTVIVRSANGAGTPYVLLPEDIGPDDDLDAMTYSSSSSFEDEIKAIVARYPDKLVDYALLAEIQEVVVKKGGDLTSHELGRDASGDEKINWHLMQPLADANNDDLRNTDVAVLTLKALNREPLPGVAPPQP